MVVWQDGGPVRARLSRLREARAQTLRRQVARFGTGSFDAVYRSGPLAHLIGRRTAAIGVAQGGRPRATVDGGTSLRVERRAGVVPAWVSGRLDGGEPPGRPLALALDGTVVAVTRSYRWRGATRFSAVLPPTAFHAGANRLDVFALETRDSRPVLVPLTAPPTKRGTRFSTD